MKKIFTLILVFSLVMSFAAFAENDITITVNSVPLVLDVAPDIVEGRTMVPMRAVFEALGANVSWQAENQLIIATSGSYIISLVIGSSVMLCMDVATGIEKSIALDVAPYINNGRTLVPLRAVSEVLGATVDWNGETRAITITK